jgi:hypothetical protein
LNGGSGGIGTGPRPVKQFTHQTDDRPAPPR